MLVAHFASLAGQTPPAWAHLDVLTRALLPLTAEVPLYAAAVARARLDRLSSRLSAALSDPLGAGELRGWPGGRGLLQLRLFGCLFPTSDRRHAVTTPLALLLGRYLAACPVTCPAHAGHGLALAGLALANAAPGARHCPEALMFTAACLAQLGGDGSSGGGAAAINRSGNCGNCGAAAAVHDAGSRFTPGVLALACCTAAAAGGSSGAKRRGQDKAEPEPQAAAAAALPRLCMRQLLSLPADDPQLSDEEFKLRLLGCALATARRAAEVAAAGVGAALPEVLAPLLAALAPLAAQHSWLPAPLAAEVIALRNKLRSDVDAATLTRLPAVQSSRCAGAR